MKNINQAGKPLDTQGRIARKLRLTARTLLLALTILAFVFALLSGANEAGGGVYGVIKNSPNALPWLALLIFVLIACKWELVGGFLIVAMGVGSIFFFDTFQENRWLVLFFISLPLLVLGSFFIGAWGFSQNNGSEKNEQD